MKIKYLLFASILFAFGCASKPSSVDNCATKSKSSELIYPEESKALGEQGTVVLKFLVNTKGNAETIVMVKTSGYPRLDQSATDWIKSICFAPKIKNDKPVSVWAQMPITFKTPIY